MVDVRMPKPIFIISDGTGDTAEKSVRAALLQFQGYLVHVQTFPHVTEPEQLGQLFRVAARSRALVATTLVRSEMRSAAQRLAKEHRIRTVDLMGDLLELLTGYLQAQPEGVPGRMHRADEFYFKRIEAVEFTVKADDGKELRMLKDADIVLVGVSRTSKTPLSVFLAHKGYKVSNVPVVLDKDLRPEVVDVDQRRVFALTIDPESLQEIRQQRLATMRMTGNSSYGDIEHILAELDWADAIFRQHPTWPVIDVTRKAVEETAATIIKALNSRGLTLLQGEVGQLH